MKQVSVAFLLLSLAAGCSGGPLKELPVLEAPPLEPEPAPPPSPIPATEAPEVYGTWVSSALRGPGSAAFKRMEFLFRRDGAFCAVAVSPGRVRAWPGRFELHDGSLVVATEDGRERTIEWRIDEDALLLREGENEVLLRRSPD